MNFNRLAALAILIAIAFGCSREEVELPTRPHAPWAFRSVLDGKARMLTVALHDDLWLAYDTETAALQKAWRGSVNFDGAVYTTVHGPQPSSLGDSWMENPYQEPWRVVLNGEEQRPRVQYQGHQFKTGQLYLKYQLLLRDGQAIQVEERPEYVTNEYRQTGFERSFWLSGVPAGAEVLFLHKYQSLPTATSLVSSGTFIEQSTEVSSAYDGQSTTTDGVLQLNNNALTTLTARFNAKPTIPNSNKVVGAEAEERRPLGYRLIARSDCRTCHNAIVKTIGPSYNDIATRYRNTEDNIAMLINKVQQGGAGNWGEAAMTPHPDLPESQVRPMIQYIMNMDAAEEAKLASIATADDIDLATAVPAVAIDGEFLPGLLVKAFETGTINSTLKVKYQSAPLFQGVVPQVEFYPGDFGSLEENFALEIKGYLHIPKTNNYTFRLTSDDGSRMYIDGQEIINNDGYHGDESVDGEVVLAEGYHAVRVTFFQGAGGRMLRLKWRSFDTRRFELLPRSVLLHRREDQPTDLSSELTKEGIVAGDTRALDDVHPAYTLSQARPKGFSPKVAGMDFLPDGRLAISTWDAEGNVYLLDGVETGDPTQISYERIATGLAEPLGLKVVDGEIYVLQKQELTHLIDHDGDDLIDEYRTLSNDWKVSANFHEFAFGLEYKAPYFYAALAIGIMPGGASAPNQPSDRGKAIRIHGETGKMDIIAEGLRTPNGVGIGVDDEIFIADNQGDWLPACKIMHITEGAFFGSHAVDSARVAALRMKPPVVWLPQDEIGNSPSTPSIIEQGVYKGQMIHGEVTHGGVKRVFVEKVDGEYQGCVFRFIQGLEAGVNRLTWGPDGGLYVGGIGSGGNWQHSGKLWYGLQRLMPNEQSAFEMLAVRAKSNGIEIELTEPLHPDFGAAASEYDIQQWYYQPTNAYGGPKLDEQKLAIQSVNISTDRKRIFLELEGMKTEHVVYVHLPNYWTNQAGNSLWTTEAWYTLNSIPAGTLGFVQAPPSTPVPNRLTEAERKAGWKLLFDGKSTKGWHNFGKSTIGASWKISDDALMLDVVARNDGGWQALDGGDIVSEGEYENFEFRIDWKISACGNSGIMYNVTESENYGYPWQTGPEMQVLDNTCHPDAAYAKHRAGDLYDLIEANPMTVRPAGEWNRVRIRIKDGQLQHWLNGHKVVETELFSVDWAALIAGSKFKEMNGFGQSRRGHISLQDHGDRVWFRNIKIREL